jgi:hypothetical protein
MWKDMKFAGGTSWIYAAIADDNLIGLTDGSFIKELPQLMPSCPDSGMHEGPGQIGHVLLQNSPR